MQIINFPELDSLDAVAVGVSGGADSMALLHALSVYAVSRGKSFRVLALTVDHGLRKASACEARKVAAWVADWPQVTHKTLLWKGQKPKTGIMEAARAARYSLMAAACKRAKIGVLALAHHADDQAETFFMRLSHGSGLDGLCGMRPLVKSVGGPDVYRPLLGHTHAGLVAYCRARKIRWLEDPTNRNDTYARSRLRKTLAKEGLDSKRLATTMRRLAAASNALDEIAEKAARASLQKTSAALRVYDFKNLAAHPDEVFLRVLRCALVEMGKAGYGPRLEKLEEIALALKSAAVCTRATLGGCLIEAHPRKNTLTIRREKS